jgi:hypothetical protein
MAIGIDQRDDSATWCCMISEHLLGYAPSDPQLLFQLAVLQQHGSQQFWKALYDHPDAVARRAATNKLLGLGAPAVAA